MQNSTALPKIIRAHVFITGRVQGVGYRYATVDTARQLGLTGWVRNLPDNRVEAVFEGAREVVDNMVRWCHSGPPAAVVKDVVVEYEVPEGLREFERTYRGSPYPQCTHRVGIGAGYWNEVKITNP